MGVSEAAVAPLRDDNPLAFAREVGEHRAARLVERLRPDRNLENCIGAAPAGPVLAHAMHPGLGLEMLLVAEVDQRVEAGGAFEAHIAAAAAAAADGPAEFDEFLPPHPAARRPSIAQAK